MLTLALRVAIAFNNHMSKHVQVARLPDGELGENRVFRIGYYGHGDIRIATWQGAEDADPVTGMGNVQNFGMAHGSDVLIMASFAGYYKRLGRDEDQIRDMLRAAGRAILDDSEYRSTHRWDYITAGEPYPHWDVPEQSLACLLNPTPAQPGILEHTGGTGIFTRTVSDATDRLVFGRFAPSDSGEACLVDTADFCEQDIPAMARAVCSLALGEYQADIQSFLNQLYRPEEYA